MSTSEQQPDEERHPDGALRLVDWTGTAHRMRRSGVVLGVLVVVAWLVTGLLGDGPTLGALGGWLGVGLVVAFVVEVVVVGGAAVRGMLRAGEAGERLSSEGVGLLPSRLRLPPAGDDDAGGEADDDADGGEPDEDDQVA